MSLIAPFFSNSQKSMLNLHSFQTILSKPILTGVNETLADTRNIFQQIRGIINNQNDGFPKNNEQILSVLIIEVNANIKRLGNLLKNNSMNLSATQIEEIEFLRNEGKILLSEFGEFDDSVTNSIPEDSFHINEETLKEINAQISEIKNTFSKLLTNTDVTSGTLNNYIQTRKEICNDLMDKKVIIEQLMDQDDLKYHNYNILIFIKEFERILQMIGEATFQLEEAEKKFYALGDFNAKIEMIKNEIENDGENFEEEKAERIRQEIEHCQDIIDAFEIVCNNLTAQLAELAAFSGDSIISQEAEYLVELEGYKIDLHEVRERFEKALIKSKISENFVTKEISTNTIFPKLVTVSTNTDDDLLEILKPELPIIPDCEIKNPPPKAILYTRGYQFILGFLPVILFGLTMVTLFAERSPPNNWRKMWGPQVDFDCLPPS